ncbi:MAG: GntR family transcriptional regulator [Mycoplasmatales bacterium]
MRKNKYVTQKILEKIHSGEYKNKLPTERELTKIYDCSLNTIRVALDNLKISGNITSRHGSGYYVSSIKQRSKYNSLELKSMQTTYHDRKLSSKLIDFKLYKCNHEESVKLDIKENELIYKFIRLRIIDEKPRLLSYTITPYSLFPDLDEHVLKGSFYEFCEKYSKHKISYALKDISPVVPTYEQAQLLDVKIDKPILKVENIGFLSNGVQFEYSDNYHVDEKFGVVVRVKN